MRERSFSPALYYRDSKNEFSKNDVGMEVRRNGRKKELEKRRNWRKEGMVSWRWRKEEWRNGI